MEALTVKELREMAKAKKVKGYSKMKKAELISSLKKLKNDTEISKKPVSKRRMGKTKWTFFSNAMDAGGYLRGPGLSIFIEEFDYQIQNGRIFRISIEHKSIMIEIYAFDDKVLIVNGPVISVFDYDPSFQTEVKKMIKILGSGANKIKLNKSYQEGNEKYFRGLLKGVVG